MPRFVYYTASTLNGFLADEDNSLAWLFAVESSQMPDLACLMLTSFADDEALFHAVMAGACGYVLKEVRSGDLVQVLQVLTREGGVLLHQIPQRRHGLNMARPPDNA